MSKILRFEFMPLIAATLLAVTIARTYGILCESIEMDDMDTQCSTNVTVGSVCSVSCEHPKQPTITNVTCIQIQPSVAEWLPEKPACISSCWPERIDFSNGSVACTDQNFQDSVCSFSCDRGYLISETNSVVTCSNPSGTEEYEWDSEPPHCIKIPVRCPELRSLSFSPHMRYQCDDEDFQGSVCAFSCEGRAKLSGSNSSTCVDPNTGGVGLWNPDIPSCISTFCEVPVITNGNVTCDKYDPGAVCTISCSPGFHPSSFTPFNCDEYGRWQGDFPRCVASSCQPALESIVGLAVECTQKNSPGSNCEVVCPNSSNTETFSCPLNGTGAGSWSGNITECLGCSRGIMDMLVIIDGSANLSPSDFRRLTGWLGALFSDMGGVFDSGSAWISIAVAGGDSPECNRQNSVSVTKIILPLRHMSSYLIRRKLEVLEQVGGCLHLSSSIKTAFDGLSTGVRNGIPLVAMVLLAGDSIDDYTNVTDRLKDEYDSKFIAIGVGLKESSGLSHISSEASMHIASLSKLHSATRTMRNKVVKRTCRGMSMCAEEPISNGTLACSQIPSKKKLYDEICTMLCSNGSVLVGNATAICGDTNEDGIMEWMSPKASCEVIECPARQALENGLSDCTNGNAFASFCSFTCLPDYHMVGLSQSFCGDPTNEGIARWSSSVPLCVKPLTCEPKLDPPAHGSLNCSHLNTFGSECHFTCDERYELSGGGILHCGNVLSDGSVEWKDTPPTCGECESSDRYCKLDMILLLDGSSSVEAEEFSRLRHWILQFLKEYEGRIDSGDTQIGIIQYSGDAMFMCSSGKIFPKYEVAVDLAKRSFRDIGKKLDEMERLTGCTATGDAINRAVQHLDTMGRSQVDRVVLILTDGVSYDDVTEPKRRAREKGIKIVMVPIGQFETSDIQLQSVAEVVHAPSFSDLKSSINMIRQEIRNAIQGVEDDTSYSKMGCDLVDTMAKDKNLQSMSAGC